MRLCTCYTVYTVPSCVSSMCPHFAGADPVHLPEAHSNLRSFIAGSEAAVMWVIVKQLCLFAAK